jgi:OOP family OmpA-OmpF porin
MKKLIVALVANVVVLGAAQAQVGSADMTNTYNPRPYVGVAVNAAKNQSSDDWKASPKVFAGYDINQNWGVEAGYTHFSKEDFNAFNGTAMTSAQVRGSSSYVAAKYTMPINDRFSAYGKLGASYNDRKVSMTGLGDYHDRDTSAYGALGVQYAINQNVSVVGEYERYGKDKNVGAKADALSVGLKYGF